MENNTAVQQNQPLSPLAQLKAKQALPSIERFVMTEGNSVIGTILDFESFTNYGGEQWACIILTEDNKRVSVALNAWLKTGFRNKGLVKGSAVAITYLGKGYSKGGTFNRFSLDGVSHIQTIDSVPALGFMGGV